MNRHHYDFAVPIACLIIRTSSIASLLLLLGCVNLDKPENVRNCAGSSEGCSDDNPGPKSDAADGQKSSADTRFGDAGLTPDGPQANPDGSGDSGSSPDIVDTLLRRDSAQVELDAGLADGSTEDALVDDVAVDLPFDVQILFDLPAPLDSTMALDLPQPDLPVPDLKDADFQVLDLPPDLTLDTQPDAQVSCFAQIISNGYKAGSAPACSECRDNTLSLATKCTQMIDCLAPKPAPRTSDVFMLCRNQVGGSTPVGDCVTALAKAGCPNGY